MEKLIYCKEIYSSTTTNTIQRLSVIQSTESLCLFLFDANRSLVSIQYANHLDLSKKKAVFDALERLYTIEDSNLYYCLPSFTLVPRKLFLYGHERAYMQNMHKINDKDILFTDQCDEEQIINIYAIPIQEDMVARQAINGIRTKHIATEWVKSTKVEEGKLYVYFFGSDCVVSYYDGKSPTFITIHAIRSHENLLMIIQQCTNTFGISDASIYLMGIVDATSDVVKFIQQHKPAVRLYSQSLELNASFIVS